MTLATLLYTVHLYRPSVQRVHQEWYTVVFEYLCPYNAGRVSREDNGTMHLLRIANSTCSNNGILLVTSLLTSDVIVGDRSPIPLNFCSRRLLIQPVGRLEVDILSHDYLR